jgi:hypothetical protein
MHIAKQDMEEEERNKRKPIYIERERKKRRQGKLGRK